MSAKGLNANSRFVSATAKPFEEVQKRVAELLKDRILIGHAVFNDLKVGTTLRTAAWLDHQLLSIYFN